MERGRALRIPAGAFLARVLQSYRTADRLREHSCVDAGVTGVVAAIGARRLMRDAFDLVRLHAEDRSDAVAAVVRFRRAGPHRRAIRSRIDDTAARAHAGMGLERPLVLMLDHTRGGLERLVDVADLLA